MLCLEKCRRLLPPGYDICDDELEQLRDRLTALAEVAVDQALAASRDVKEALRAGGRPFAETLRVLPEEERESIEERAAIREFDGGQNRRDAEYFAMNDYVRRTRSQT